MIGSDGERKGLSSVYLNSVQDIGMAEFSQLIVASGHFLKLLDLTGTNLALAALPSPGLRLSNLESLILANCTKGDLDVKRMLLFCGPSLKTLNLTASSVSGEDLTGSNLSLINLEDLNLSGCKLLSDRGLKVILGLCGPNLKSLDLGKTEIHCHGLSDSNIMLWNLQSLNLSSCADLITDYGLSEVISICGPKLKVSSCTVLKIGWQIVKSSQEGQTATEYS